MAQTRVSAPQGQEQNRGVAAWSRLWSAGARSGGRRGENGCGEDAGAVGIDRGVRWGGRIVLGGGVVPGARADRGFRGAAYFSAACVCAGSWSDGVWLARGGCVRGAVRRGGECV